MASKGQVYTATRALSILVTSPVEERYHQGIGTGEIDGYDRPTFDLSLEDEPFDHGGVQYPSTLGGREGERAVFDPEDCFYTMHNTLKLMSSLTIILDTLMLSTLKFLGTLGSTDTEGRGNENERTR